MPDLEVRGLSKRFGDQVALEDVSFTVGDGEFFTLLGPSGCGKSTTLSTIAGLEHPDTGSIEVGDTVFVDAASGRFRTPEERNLGMVFQSYALWPHMTVRANLALPLKLRRVGRAEQRRRIEETLDQVGLLSYIDRYPHQLSGGQQQRVALARALVYSPTVLLLDEPLSNLDAKLRERARAWLKDLQQRVGVTTVYVTHDQLEALSLSDRLAVMQEGQMLQVGSPKEIYEQPASVAVADFVGRCSFLDARIRGEDADGRVVAELGDGGVRVRLGQQDGQRPAGSSVTVGIRSERLQVTPVRHDLPAEHVNAVPADVVKAAYVGARYEYELLAAGRRLLAESDVEVRDEQVWVIVPEDGVYMFAEEPPAAEPLAVEETST
ncbi:MAG: ABC transporter ATP-binding protein [Streptosporangiales bacterium]